MPTPAFGVVLIKGGPEVESAASVQTVTAVPHSVGTLGRIVEVDQRDDGMIHLVVLGDARFRDRGGGAAGPYLVARVTYLDDRPGTDAATLGELSAAARTLGQRYLRLLAAALSRDDDDGSQLLERAVEAGTHRPQRLLLLPRGAHPDGTQRPAAVAPHRDDGGSTPGCGGPAAPRE